MPAPKVVNTPTQLIDIFPTVMEHAGVDVSTLPLDGASLAPLLTPPANASATDTNTPRVRPSSPRNSTAATSR